MRSFYLRGHPPPPHSFPTRRSSDLNASGAAVIQGNRIGTNPAGTAAIPNFGGIEASGAVVVGGTAPDASDRKSTRLNSSHSSISYAVFCLKKKNKSKQL